MRREWNKQKIYQNKKENKMQKIRYNKLRKLKIAEKVDTACRSLVE